MRVTIKHLEALAAEINKALGAPQRPYEDGKAQIGCYYISRQNGGFCLDCIANSGGAATGPLGEYHRPARQLADEMTALIVGIHLGRQK